MRSPVLVSVLTLALAGASLANAAYAQPPGAYRDAPHYDADRRDFRRYDDRQPPPGWDRRNWEYRRTYERRHPEARRDWRRDDDHGDALIAGILGFVLGAAIAGSQSDQEHARARLNDKAWAASCARKHRSFDPGSGTYLGADGLRHYCR